MSKHASSSNQIYGYKTTAIGNLAVLDLCYVYLLASDDEKLYVGMTNNLNRRMQEHQKGSNKSTRFRANRWRIQALFGPYPRVEAAMREFALKRMPRKAKLQLVSGAVISKIANVENSRLDQRRALAPGVC